MNQNRQSARETICLNGLHSPRAKKDVDTIERIVSEAGGTWYSAWVMCPNLGSTHSERVKLEIIRRVREAGLDKYLTV